MTTKEAKVTLKGIIDKMSVAEEDFLSYLAQVHPEQQESARNFLHYLVLRSMDIRDLQDYLHSEGLSSLTSSESYTLFQLQQTLRWLTSDSTGPEPPCDYYSGRKKRARKVAQLFGGKKSHPLHIMVTFPSEFSESVAPIERLLHEGMTVARINCSHDDEIIWDRMLQNLKQAKKNTGMECKIYMDLPGPKLRTRAFDSGEQIQKLEVGSEVILSDRNLDDRYTDVPVIYIHPEGIMNHVKVGDVVYFDDGKFKARVVKIQDRIVRMEILRVSSKKGLLKLQKGVNFPDTTLDIRALTPEDEKAIGFAIDRADLIGYSFVQSAQDIRDLRNFLDSSTSSPPKVILKIERLTAVDHLPFLLFEGMKDELFGVMIARGDLAVEIGFERMSEIQEQILWLCEAAHVPTIWATQVLESMNKKGFAARSEISDATMGAMADCIMLNKGPFVDKSVRTLVNILQRHARQHVKKRYRHRKLSIARRFMH